MKSTQSVSQNMALEESVRAHPTSNDMTLRKQSNETYTRYTRMGFRQFWVSIQRRMLQRDTEIPTNLGSIQPFVLQEKDEIPTILG